MWDYSDYNNVKNYLLNEYNVSQETFLCLEQYVVLLLKWNRSINLISKSTVKHVWSRHILDSAQLISFINSTNIVLDIGSGSGLPGLVLSILGVKHLRLVDSDLRKSVFLQEAKKFSKNKVEVHNCLFTDLKIAIIDIITCRALTNVDDLLDMVSKKLGHIKSKLLLPKGKNWQEEIDMAKKKWNFEYTIYPSITNNQAVIVSLCNFNRK